MRHIAVTVCRFSNAAVLTVADCRRSSFIAVVEYVVVVAAAIVH